MLVFRGFRQSSYKSVFILTRAADAPTNNLHLSLASARVPIFRHKARVKVCLACLSIAVGGGSGSRAADKTA